MDNIRARLLAHKGGPLELDSIEAESLGALIRQSQEACEMLAKESANYKRQHAAEMTVTLRKLFKIEPKL